MLLHKRMISDNQQYVEETVADLIPVHCKYWYRFYKRAKQHSHVLTESDTASLWRKITDKDRQWKQSHRSGRNWWSWQRDDHGRRREHHGGGWVARGKRKKINWIWVTSSAGVEGGQLLTKIRKKRISSWIRPAKLNVLVFLGSTKWSSRIWIHNTLECKVHSIAGDLTLAHVTHFVLEKWGWTDILNIEIEIFSY